MKIEENIKIKNILKKLYENQEFDEKFEDEVTSWNDEEEVYEEYVFKYYSYRHAIYTISSFK